MNLSALNKPSSNPPAVTGAEAAAPVSALSRLTTTRLSGADFASFLHNQVQAIKTPQRQALAAEHGKLPQPRPDRPAADQDEPGNATRAKPGKSTDKDHATASKTMSAKASHKEQISDQTQTDSEASAQARLDQQQNEQTLADAQASVPAGVEQQAGEPTQTATPKQSVPDTLTDADKPVPETGVPEQADSLTTIALSDSLQIITAAQTSPSEKSVADFALAMGLDPGQVKALFGPDSVAAATANTKTALSTQDMLGLNTMPSYTPPEPSATNGPDELPAGMQALALNTPVSSADFQALQQVAPPSDGTTDTDLLAKMENMQLQTGSAQAIQTATTAPPPSTLSVLSMMDASLRAEDIDSLKKEFDNLYSSTDAIAGATDLPTPAGAPAQRPAHQAGLTTAQVFADRPDLAQTYENLSHKLSTELAARMHEKLNAGEWKMKFALKPASLGLVDVQLEMRDGKLTAQFQSDTPLTQELIQNGSQRLKDALADLGLNNASVFVSQGQSQSGGQAGQQAPSGLPVQRGENRAKLTEQPGAKIAETSAPKRNKRSQFDSYA